MLAISVLEYTLRHVRNVCRYRGHNAEEQGLVILPGATDLFSNDDAIKTAAHDNTFNCLIQVQFEIDAVYPNCR